MDPVSLCRCTTRTTADVSREPAGAAAGGAYPLTVNVALSLWCPLFHDANALSPPVARLAAVALLKLPAPVTAAGFSVPAPFRSVWVSVPEVRP